VLPLHPTSDNNTSLHHAALLDGDRFVVVFSQFPTTVAMVVDVVKRKIVAEVSIAGCADVHAAGPTRFASLCGDGTALLPRLDETGIPEAIERSPAFFDVIEETVSMAGVRRASSWFFISFEGTVHEVDFPSDAPVAREV
jgi:methylamine dehydrogenase heavy chain